MPTQGERQNYMWRPNDNSSTTKLRYDLEAEHWYTAFKNAESKNKPTDWGATFGIIGMVITLVFNIIWMLLYGLKKLITWIFN
jgi:hypothetical protein